MRRALLHPLLSDAYCNRRQIQQMAGVFDWVEEAASSAVAWTGEAFADAGDAILDAGSAIGDGLKAVASVVSDVTDAIGSIPGLHEVAGLFKDFANTAVGRVFMRWATPLLMAIPMVGAVLGCISFAVPGLVRGERIDKAYLSETVAAIKAAGGGASDAAMAEGAKIIVDQLPQATAMAIEFYAQGKAYYEEGQNIAEDVKALAARANVSIDVANLAIKAARRPPVQDVQDGGLFVEFSSSLLFADAGWAADVVNNVLHAKFSGPVSSSFSAAREREAREAREKLARDAVDLARVRAIQAADAAIDVARDVQLNEYEARARAAEEADVDRKLDAYARVGAGVVKSEGPNVGLIAAVGGVALLGVVLVMKRKKGKR